MSLNTYPSRSTTITSRYSNWQLLLAFSLVAWLSGSLLLDVIVMPTLYATGMMTSPDFATTGYSLFWIVNRLEILCAALVLTGAMGWSLYHRPQATGTKAVAIAAVMMTIAVISTYWFTPVMSALSLNLNGLETVETIPTAMNWMHGGYFGLESLKFVLGLSLGIWVYQQDTIAPEHADVRLTS
ncbi:MAG: DUF4149 domain-containing protein [Leptolyngbyaceae cyanobacterium]